MTITYTPPSGTRYADQVAAEVRAALGRKMMSKHALAVALGETDVWVSRRLLPGKRRVAIDLDELARIARALDVRISDLLPRVDSNHQPAGYSGRELGRAA